MSKASLVRIGLAALATTVGAPVASAAQTWNIDFGDNTGQAYSGTAAAPDAGAVWNDVKLNDVDPNAGDQLLDSQGNLTNVTLHAKFGDPGLGATFRYIDEDNDTGAGSTQIPTGFDALLRDYTVNSDSQKPVVFWLEGLDPSKTYDVYFYTAPHGPGTQFNLGAASLRAVSDVGTPTSAPSGFGDPAFALPTTQSSPPADLLAGETWNLLEGVSLGTQDRLGLAADATGTPSIMKVALEDAFGSSSGYFNDLSFLAGVQVVEVPEPGSLALLTAGGALVLTRRKRTA